MEIAFRHKLQQECQVRLVFDNLVDAVHHLKLLVDKFGTDEYTAVFKADETLKIQIIPFIGGNGLIFDKLLYDQEEFVAFCDNLFCQNSFKLFFGFFEESGFMSVNLNDRSFIHVKGYGVESVEE